MNYPASIPADWTRLSTNCFVDKAGKPHFKSKLTTKFSPKERVRSINYSQKYSKKISKTSKTWKKYNPKIAKKHQDKVNENNASCKKLVIKLRQKLNIKSIKITAKKLEKKRQNLGYSTNCAEFHHNRCVNLRKKCKCTCHKNT